MNTAITNARTFCKPNTQQRDEPDGGFVDWAEKLTSNHKERMLTSGLGLELLLKLRNRLI